MSSAAFLAADLLLHVATLAVPALMALLAVVVTVWLGAWSENRRWRRDLCLDAYLGAVRVALSAAHHAGAVMAVLQQGAATEVVAMERVRFQLALSELDSATLVAQWTVSATGADAIREMTKYFVTTVTPFVQTASDTAGWQAIASGMRSRVGTIESAAREELGLSLTKGQPQGSSR